MALMMNKRYDCFCCPENKKIRVIIDSDAGCECDDQYAILHGLMSRKMEVRGILAEQFGEPAAVTMGQSYEEISRVLALAGLECGGVAAPAGNPDEVATVSASSAAPGNRNLASADSGCLGAVALSHPIPFVYHGSLALQYPMPSAYHGAEGRFESCGPVPAADGIDFLIEEALRQDERPLFVICQGALTNIAWALKKEPDIAQCMTMIMIGGVNYPEGGFEFNTMNDSDAFNYVMGSALPVWMIPEEVYSTLQVGFMEIADRVGSCGPVGRYLTEKMAKASARLARIIAPLPGQTAADFTQSFPCGESWALGDLAGVGVLLAHNPGRYKMVPAPLVHADGRYYFSDDSRMVRWYERIDGRFILEDFFAKIKYYFS